MRALNFYGLAAIIILLGYMVWGALFFWQQQKRVHLFLCRPDCQNADLTGADIRATVLDEISVSGLDLSEIKQT
jgi:uncharacterized protein YjbI with pentapeptide repeats